MHQLPFISFISMSCMIPSQCQCCSLFVAFPSLHTSTTRWAAGYQTGWHPCWVQTSLLSCCTPSWLHFHVAPVCACCCVYFLVLPSHTRRGVTIEWLLSWKYTYSARSPCVLFKICQLSTAMNKQLLCWLAPWPLTEVSCMTSMHILLIAILSMLALFMLCTNILF